MDVLISCVAEDDERWFERVENLTISVRDLGDPMANTGIVANFVGSITPSFRNRLASYDVEVQVVEPFRSDNPFSNKLRMLELARSHSFDILLMLDCDVIVSGDITASLDPERIGASLDWGDPLSDSEWKFLFQQFEIEEVERSLRHPADRSQVYPYFNTGVISVPRGLCARLLDVWSEGLDVIADSFQNHPELRTKLQNHNQFAFCGALLSAELPLSILPISLNFPTGRQANDVVDVQPPFIIHYRSNIDQNGFVRASAYHQLNPHIHAFNQHRARRLGLKYRRLPRKSVARRLAERSPLVRRIVVALLKVRQRWSRLLGRKPRRISHIKEEHPTNVP